jgi:hypothetical protein
MKERKLQIHKKLRTGIDQTAMKLLVNPVVSQRSKHIDVLHLCILL